MSTRRRSTRLTVAEIDACISALEAGLAGPADGGPFERGTEDETERCCAAARRASDKLKERLGGPDDA